MITNVEYQGLRGCMEISNGDASIVVPTQFGPRILSYRLSGGENILGWHPEAKVETQLGEWYPYGGHRLWMAPEIMPLSYAPDNEPIQVDPSGEFGVRLSCRADLAGMQKEMIITLAESGSTVTIDNRLTASRPAVEEFAAWALTIMRPGGEVVIPNEPAAPYGGDTLTPTRSMTLWPWTDLTDPRYRFEKEHLILRVDDSIAEPQKIGVSNRQGWASYRSDGLTFTKRFDFVEGATYPDLGANVETYTAGNFVELETLSPLMRAEPGKTIVHRETWELA